MSNINRRVFVGRLARGAALVAAGGLTGLSFTGCAGLGTSNLLYEDLATLASPCFAQYAGRYAAPEARGALLQTLLDKGVVSLEQGVYHEHLAALADKDPVVAYQGFYYAETELELYALAWLVTQQSA